MISAEQLDQAAREAAEALRHFELPFGRQAWLGQQGNWLGSGLGSSIDFQDHRDYMPGDDPRYIHWAAYARTGQLTMKLYRAEVSPLVDIVLDVSASMFEFPEKALRAASLLAFCVAAADAADAPARVHLTSGGILRTLPAELVRTKRWTDFMPQAGARNASPGPLPWRPSAMKILISDLLFPEPPETQLSAMSGGTGLGLLLTPQAADEAELKLRGNLEMLDVESGEKRSQRIDEAIAERYRKAYARHFELWEEAARRRGILFCPLPCEQSLKETFAQAPSTLGAVVLRNR